MLQKVIQVGNSAAITIPKQVLEETGLMIGDQIEIKATKKPVKIEVFPRQRVLSKTSGITPSFIRSVEDFVRDYKPVLEELARR